MTTRRFVLLSVVFVLMVAAAPLIDVMVGGSWMLIDPPTTYRLPLKDPQSSPGGAVRYPGSPSRPAPPWYAYAERIDWEAFGRLDVPGLVALAYGDFSGSGTGRFAQVVTVSTGKAPNRICNATCSSASSDCIAGTALASFTDSSETKPYLIDVMTGAYPECVVVNNRTDIAFLFRPGALLRPPVATALDIDGGAFRVAPITTTANTTVRISVIGGEFWDDAWPPISGNTPGSEEGAVTLGQATLAAATQGWNDVYFSDTKMRGNHTGLSIYGTRSASSKNIPRLMITDADIVGGAIGVKHARHMTITEIDDSLIRAQSNYCDSRSAADQSEFTGAVVAGTASTVTLQGSAPGTNNVLNGRTIVLSGASCPSNGTSSGTSYDGAGKVLTSSGFGFGVAPDANCTYTIAAVANTAGTGATARQTSAYPACTSVGWAQIRGTGVGSSGAPVAGVIIGPTPAAGGDLVAQRFTMRGSKVIVDANDYADSGDAVCSDFTTSGHNGEGVLGIGITAFNAGELIHDVIFEDVETLVNINVDTKGTFNTGVGGCLVAAGLVIPDNAKVLGKVGYSGKITVRNYGDGDLGVACVRAAANQVGTLSLGQMVCDIDKPTTTNCTGACGAQASTSTTLKVDATDPVATDGYNGLYVRMVSGACAGQIRKVWDFDSTTDIAQIAPKWAAACAPGAGDDYVIGYVGVWDDYDASSVQSWGVTTIMQENTTALEILGAVSSPDLITTTGTIKGWSEHCWTNPHPTGGWVAGTDNQTIPVSDGNVGMQVAYVGCRCMGSCGASNGSLDFHTSAAANFATAVACVEPGGDMTWTDVRADADSFQAAGKSPQFDTNAAPTTATDDVQVCLRYSTTRFAP